MKSGGWLRAEGSDRRPGCATSSWARRALLAGLAAGALCWLAAADAQAQSAPVQRTVFKLPASNGHCALLLDLEQARLTHFREHLFATEEPLLDAAGNEVWANGQFQSVPTRDLLYDAYFGLRVGGSQAWLTADPVDLDASGYAPYVDGATGGTGVLRMVQHRGALQLEQYAFTPRGLDHAGFVMALHVVNTGAVPATGVSVFTIHNFHLGFGRPGVNAEIGEQNETVSYDGAAGRHDLLERAFAGVVVARPLGTVAHHAGSSSLSPPNQNIYAIVNGGAAVDLPDLAGQAPTANGSISGFQFDLGDLAAGDERWVGVVFAHHGDPFGAAQVQGWLDQYVAAEGAQALVEAEIAAWAGFQAALTVPAGLSAGDETLFRHSAVMLDMAQVHDSHAYLREWLSTDGEPRYTRFGTTLNGPPATLPATIAHRGDGAVIASLPPGEWTVAWIRDGSYAAAAMAAAGMSTEARAALSFYLGAEAGRFQSWSELAGYGMPPYLISLTRYQGFGVEETDFNDHGPNLEFDGIGLFLWALRRYELASGDTTLVDDSWPIVSTEVADVLVALIDPATGLLRPDSSIWEHHWNGWQRTWTYSNITAARGLCDAAALAGRVGDTTRATQYHDAAVALRQAIAEKLTDASHALASNAEELAEGEGYWDAAVLDALAFELFHPTGAIAQATLAGLDTHLGVPAGAGWSRNDDLTDHGGGNDLSPWGSSYDSAEWVVTDLRGAVAATLGGDVARRDQLSNWVRDQALANYLEVAETFDESTGLYKFNSPMMGFGAGAYVLALAARSAQPDPACGAYFDQPAGGGGGAGGSGAAGGSGGGQGAGTPSGGSAGFVPGAGGNAQTDEGCGCRIARRADPSGQPWTAGLFFALAAGVLARRRRSQS